jgi:hypothetical protein
MEKQLLVYQSTLLDERTDTDVFILSQQVDVTILSSSPLMGHVGQAIASTGRHTDSVRKTDFVIHQIIQHTASEDASHTASFKHQTCLFVYIQHRITPFFESFE